MSEHTQTTTTTGRRRKSSRPADDLRALLSKIHTANPRADWIAVVNLFIEEHVQPKLATLDDPEEADRLVDALREWAMAQDPEPRRRRATPEQLAERAAAKAAIIDEIATRDNKRIEAIVERRMMDWEVINGRRLGDLSGADCRNLSERLGVFFHVLSDIVPARGKVCNHVTELELQSLARHHKLGV